MPSQTNVAKPHHSAPSPRRSPRRHNSSLSSMPSPSLNRASRTTTRADNAPLGSPSNLSNSHHHNIMKLKPHDGSNRRSSSPPRPPPPSSLERIFQSENHGKENEIPKAQTTAAAAAMTHPSNLNSQCANFGADKLHGRSGNNNDYTYSNGSSNDTDIFRENQKNNFQIGNNEESFSSLDDDNDGGDEELSSQLSPTSPPNSDSTTSTIRSINYTNLKFHSNSGGSEDLNKRKNRRSSLSVGKVRLSFGGDDDDEDTDSGGDGDGTIDDDDIEKYQHKYGISSNDDNHNNAGNFRKEVNCSNDDNQYSSSNNANDCNYDNNDYGDDDYDDDDDSECSGDTVIAQDENDPPNPPPPNATQEEMNRYYWEWCYGPAPEALDVIIHAESVEKGVAVVGSNSWSALRSAPAKSCLSNKKKNDNNGSSMTTPSLTPRILHQSPITNFDFNNDGSNLSTPNDSEESPPNNNNMGTNANSNKLTNTNPRIQSAVKFGTNSAAEFDFQQPITEMTPIPTMVVQRIFPTDVVDTEKELEDYGVSRETARNVATLAEWDDDFDDIISQDGTSDDDDDENENGGGHRRGRKRTPFKGRGRRSSTTLNSGSTRRNRRRNASRPKKSRRESSIFSRERRSLLDDNDSEDESNGGLPFSVINGEYSSPSTASIHSDVSTTLASVCINTSVREEDVSMLTTELDTPLINKRESLDSRTSAYISPSSSKSDTASVVPGTDASFTTVSTATIATTGKETPKSARRSSSTILRAVHASGALLPTNSPSGVAVDGLRPNQLKYSPGSSTVGRSESTLSDDSEGIDVIDSNNFCKILSIVSNHPARMFHVKVSDLAKMISETSQEDQSIKNDIFGNMKTPSSLALMVNGNAADSIFTGNSQWVQSAFFKYNGNNHAESSYAQKCFETILRDKITEASANPSSNRRCETRSSKLLDDTTQTISACLEQCLEISSKEWRTIEVDIAIKSLREFQESSKEIEGKTSYCKKHVLSCWTQLQEASTKAAEELSNAKVPLSSQNLNRTKLRRKRKVLSQIEDESKKIKALEEELTLEVERLVKAKRAKMMFGANLKMERGLSLSEYNDRIRTDITPTPCDIHEYIQILLLDNIVEISLKIDDENEDFFEIGCYIPEGGASAKFLQALVAGNMDYIPNESSSTFPLRSTLYSIILANETRNEKILEACQLLFKLDTLAKCIRVLETECFCSVDNNDSGNVTVSISTRKEGNVIQTSFLFENVLKENWIFTTIPSDVTVEIVSSENESANISSRLTAEARVMISSPCRRDPMLLKKVCDNVMDSLDNNS